MSIKERFVNCFLLGAIGDAFGQPIRNMSYDEIIKEYGEEGKTEFLGENSEIGRITDVTQMSLFTAEGLLWAKSRIDKIGACNIASRCFYSYQRWLHTQGYDLGDEAYSWVLCDERLEVKTKLLKDRRMYHKSTYTETCIRALSETINQDYGTLESPINSNRGNEGVMRVAPVALCFSTSPRSAFDIGTQVAAITNSHPTAYLSAGALCAVLSYIMHGTPLETAINATVNLLGRFAGSDGTSESMKLAVSLYKQGKPSMVLMKQLGKGVYANESLAIALYSALHYPNDFMRALQLATNHSGDSSCTGAICGCLYGVMDESEFAGEFRVDCKELVLDMANRIYEVFCGRREKGIEDKVFREVAASKVSH